jgi:hypothetical protein
MGGSYVGNAATFLIETLFGLYILIVMLIWQRLCSCSR